MAYWVYIIYSKKIDHFYIGSTADITGRLRRHNSKHKGFTGRANDWVLVYSIAFDKKSDAICKEKTLKKLKSKKMILSLIKINPSLA